MNTFIKNIISKFKNDDNDDSNISIFDADFEQIWPKNDAMLNYTENGLEMLKNCATVAKPAVEHVDIQELMQKSDKFPVEFGTNSCRVMSQPAERYPNIEEQIRSVYPVIHERVLALYIAFLEHKRKYGNQIELAIYEKMDVIDLVQRLLAKRCVVFVGPADYYTLLNGKTGMGGFTEVGTVDEQPPLTLENVLSYDEIKLSAFLSVSTHTEFLNDGNRHNAGKFELDKSKIERDGVVIGMIGGRFQMRDMMEWQDIIISESQNTKERGYGYTAHDAQVANNREVDYRQLWTSFYEEPDVLYENVSRSKEPRFHQIPHTAFVFDNLLMKKRYTISFDTLLLEAEARGRAAEKLVYLHVVGFGLGVWKAVEHQNQIFLEVFTQRLRALLPSLTHIGVVHFSYFYATECRDLVDDGLLACDAHPKGGIRTFLSNRNPSEKLSPDFDNMLPVVSFAWDANALPGNEFWDKSLTSSSDPAAACSTLITELYNPHINTEFANGKNLHIASEKYGVLHISDYAKRVLEKLN